MNSLLVILIAGVLFYWGYRFYAQKVAQLWHIDPKKSTPAYSKFDSVDFIPAKNWLVLFGHHFSSIAGAGPIVGPVIACVLWGWLPALLWIVLGSVFLGGVHDFGALITSVKEGGSSIADISERAISKRTKILFSLFVWLALILVIAVFAYLCADTFIKVPEIVIPSLGLIPLAMIIGLLLYNIKTNFALTTVFGLVLLVGLISLGKIFPITLGRHALNIWIAVLFIYSYFASVLPVNILLQPRDYLSSFLL
ncbi:MAG: carbon starvation protein A, partial [Candidatus Omnitrophica bacterium]|nr:carbon starvation protein A [Candidatus Omnitrophota bacterium]